MNVMVEVEKDDEMLNVVVIKENDEILNEIVTDFGQDEVIVSDFDVEMMLIVPYDVIFLHFKAVMINQKKKGEK